MRSLLYSLGLCLLGSLFLGYYWKKDDGKIEIVFLHVNDIYEIAPLEGGKSGGMARLATVYKNLLRKNPNTFLVHAGDFLSPSILGGLSVDEKPIRGRQMVEVMNACGFSIAIFGNHEFDLGLQDLLQRINESQFSWVSTNTFQTAHDSIFPFHRVSPQGADPIAKTLSYRLRDADGTKISLGIMGITQPITFKDYIHYEDPYEAAKSASQELLTYNDLVVGLTHMDIVADLKLAGMLKEVPLLMGGHDHDHMLEKVNKTTIAKADANAKTAYIHRIVVNIKEGTQTLTSELIPIDDKIKEDKEVASIVQKWQKILETEVKKVIASPYEILMTATDPLEGKESIIRYQQTNLGQLIGAGMASAAKQAVDAVIFNSGSVRIDDQLKGGITPIDIYRTLPFGGSLTELDVKGSVLQKLLDAGEENKGKGGYLQRYQISYSEDKVWIVQQKTLDTTATYHIIVPSFLFTGQEKNMGFFKPGLEGVEKVVLPQKDDPNDPRNDVRMAIIQYISRLPKK